MKRCFKAKRDFGNLFVSILFTVIVFIGLHTELLGQTFEIRGLTMVAPPKKIDMGPIYRMKQTNANWVALVPYGFQRQGQSGIRFNLTGQWWGENVEGIKATIDLAHCGGMKVMLKPQIYIHGAWTGDIDFKNEEDWVIWEKDYTAYIMEYVKVASDHDVELFCLGTELKMPLKRRKKYFEELISSIRKVYKGKLTYAANWDDYDKTDIWNLLDIIGVNAYHPLSQEATPTTEALEKEWRQYMAKMARFSNRTKRKIIFTEYGYLSIDGCAWKPWEMQGSLQKYNVNQDAQANAFESLYTCFSRQSWWAGGFIWKWFPNGMGHEGQPSKDFSPQDKKAEFVVEQWYCR